MLDMLASERCMEAQLRTIYKPEAYLTNPCIDGGAGAHAIAPLAAPFEPVDRAAARRMACRAAAVVDGEIDA
mgnify:FL=1